MLGGVVVGSFPALLASVANRPRKPSPVPAPATGTEEEVWGLSWIVL